MLGKSAAAASSNSTAGLLAMVPPPVHFIFTTNPDITSYLFLPYTGALIFIVVHLFVSVSSACKSSDREDVILENKIARAKFCIQYIYVEDARFHQDYFVIFYSSII